MEFKLKVSPQLFHHYIIGVAVHPATSDKMGQMFLKYRPIHFTNDDVEDVQSAMILANDKLFKTSKQDSLAAFNQDGLAGTLSTLKIAADFNQCTLHHFSSEFEMDEESFVNIVDAANKSNYFKELLLNSRIRG